MFFLNDISISYPHAEVERVSVVWNLIYAGAIPAIIMLIWLAASRSSLHQFHVTALGFGTRYGIQSLCWSVSLSVKSSPHSFHHRYIEECCR